MKHQNSLIFLQLYNAFFDGWWHSERPPQHPQPYAVLFNICYAVGIPAMFAILLWMIRGHLEDPLVVRILGPITGRFKEEWYWFECIGGCSPLPFANGTPFLALWPRAWCCGNALGMRWVWVPVNPPALQAKNNGLQ